MKVARVLVLALMAMATITTLRAQSNPNAIAGIWESDERGVRMPEGDTHTFFTLAETSDSRLFVHRVPG